MAWSEVQILCRGEVSVTEKEGEARWSILRAVYIGFYQQKEPIHDSIQGSTWETLEKAW